MNERIRELAKKAGAMEWGDSVVPAMMDIEKFAELIVRECMDIAREVGTSTEPEDFALDRCYEIETKIKEHFGVEE
jgi:hypothetical protein